MRRSFLIGGLVLLVLAVLSVVSVAVYADSPHFVSESAAFQEAGGAALQVSFKEAGLGDNQLINYVANAESSATYACINGGGNHPQAANKETAQGPVSAVGSFSSGKNGTISQSLVLSPVGQGAFGCPSGQALVLAWASYSDVQIADVSNGVVANMDGTFSRCFVDTRLGLC